MTLATLLLLVCCIAGLLLLPFGLPGLWVMVLGVLACGWLTDFRTITAGLIIVVVGLAFAGEVLEAWLGFRFAERYGGSRRAGWGALIGGLAGAVIGVPVPLIGSVVGGFVGRSPEPRCSSTPWPGTPGPPRRPGGEPSSAGRSRRPGRWRWAW